MIEKIKTQKSDYPPRIISRKESSSHFRIIYRDSPHTKKSHYITKSEVNYSHRALKLLLNSSISFVVNFIEFFIRKSLIFYYFSWLETKPKISNSFKGFDLIQTLNLFSKFKLNPPNKGKLDLSKVDEKGQ